MAQRPCSVAAILASLVVGVAGSAVTICPAKMASGETYYCFYSPGSSSTPITQLELIPQGNSGTVATAYPDVNNDKLFALSVPSSVTPGEYTVQAATGATRTSASSSVTVETAASMLLLESDRKLYQPGHTAKFRALAVTSDRMRPKNNVSLEFEVTSPEGFKLMSVEASTDMAGVATFEFPIAAEPLLGDHVAQVMVKQIAGQGAASMADATFTVEEYVLPRFEVNLTVDQSSLTAGSGQFRGFGGISPEPSATSPSLISITGAVDAKYTFGEQVVGKATVVAWAPQDVYYGLGKQPEPTYSKLAQVANVSVSLDSAGSFQLQVDSQRLRAGSKVVVEAMVEDDATGETQNDTSLIEVVYGGSDIEVEISVGSGKEFRPGLPVYAQVTLTKPDGKRLTADEIDASGSLSLVFQGQQVDWRNEKQTITMRSSDFSNGVAVYKTVPKDPACCDAAAEPTTREEYDDMKGCCLKALEIYVQRSRDGEEYASRVYGSDSFVALRRQYTPNGHYLGFKAPESTDAASWTATLQSTQEFSAFQASVEYMIIQGATVAASATASLSSVASSAVGKDEYSEASFTVQVPSEVAGNIELLAILRPVEAGPIMVASTGFYRSLQLPFSLSASFSEQEVQPGASLNVTLQATSQAALTDAHVFIASLDKSAELLGQRAVISARSLLATIERAREGAEPTPVAPRVWRHCGAFGDQVLLKFALPDGLNMVRSSSTGEEIEDDMTYGKPFNSTCRRPVVDQSGSGDMMLAVDDGMVPEAAMAVGAPASIYRGDSGGAGAEDSPTKDSGSSSGGTVSVRKFFPETWLWTDVALDGAGQAVVPVTAPDTITTWSLDAFATAAEGVSATRSETGLRVFKPFFVELRLPYAAIRGEELEVIIAVFNYKEGSGSLPANLAITLPPQLTLTAGSLTPTLQVPQNSASRTTIRVRASSLGSFPLLVSASATGVRDSMQKQLFVRPEGVAAVTSATMVLDLSGDIASVSDTLQMSLPDVVIPGSERLFVSAVGDLLGPTISGLERLLQIPTGCGEQNMITLAPNVFVAKYLKATGKMTPELRQRIVNNMIVGYGRELTYRHSDGSFSAFGSSDESGSTWLTSFVIRVFAEVHGTGMVAVDASVLQKAASWLISQQHSSGAFVEVGHVIHTEMQGGITGDRTAAEIALTAYVATALAKATQEIPNFQVNGLDAALTKVTTYLVNAAPEAPYGKLLRAHALGMLNHWTGRQLADECLKLSVVEDGVRYWSSGTQDGEPDVQPQPVEEGPAMGLMRVGGHARVEKTLDVELTGYGVLAMTMANDLSKAFEGARWLLSKRKASGGFHSTQDTVVALNALATYAAAAGSDVDMNLQLSNGSGYVDSVSITANNVDVMQSLSVPPPAIGATSNLTVIASGKGVALVQAELKYNLPEVSPEPCYEIEVQWNRSNGDQSRLAQISACATRTSKCSSSTASMWIMSVGLFTGYNAHDDSLNRLLKQGSIKLWEKRTDGGDFVDLYLDELKGATPNCLSFGATKQHNVYNNQPVSSTVYEYYRPEMYGATLTNFKMSDDGGDSMTPDETPSPSSSPTASQGGNTTKVSFAIVNVDYDALAANTTMLSHFTDSIKNTIADQAGEQISAEHVHVTLSKGSVQVDATIVPPAGVSSDAVQAQVSAAKDTFATSVVQAVKALPNIGSVSTGTISVSQIEVVAGTPPPTSPPTLGTEPQQPTSPPTSPPTTTLDQDVSAARRPPVAFALRSSVGLVGTFLSWYGLMSLA